MCKFESANVGDQVSFVCGKSIHVSCNKEISLGNVVGVYMGHSTEVGHVQDRVCIGEPPACPYCGGKVWEVFMKCDTHDIYWVEFPEGGYGFKKNDDPWPEPSAL